MKVIQRPDTITLVDDNVKFHLVLNEKEAKNVFKGVKKKDIVLWCKSIDMNTFSTRIFFFIRRNIYDNLKTDALAYAIDGKFLTPVFSKKLGINKNHERGETLTENLKINS